ncbi:MAG TPA: MarR family transcriptional regulator [Acidimicrobiales bacterium]
MQPKDRTEREADVTDAVLTASRVLVAVAARSLADMGDVTLPQYRALVVLSSRGPQPVGALAEALAVNPSTATRLAERLVRHGLIRKDPSASDRREVVVSLTAEGRGLIAGVTARRRHEIARILRRVPLEQQARLVEALRMFADAAGEAPEQAWSLGWTE